MNGLAGGHAAPGGILARVRAGGAAAEIDEVPADRPGDSRRLVDLLREAGSPDTANPAALLEQAGSLHDPEALDQALHEVGPKRLLSRVRGLRRRLHEAAGEAVRQTADTGTAQLCCALLGAVGGDEDVPVLEALGTHPALTLHACTALTAMGGSPAREGLLRMLSRTTGAARLVVADRLLLFADEPAVRVALVRDTLSGLSREQAAEIAPYIAVSCRVGHLADDERASPEVRAGARRILQIVDEQDPDDGSVSQQGG